MYGRGFGRMPFSRFESRTNPTLAVRLAMLLITLALHNQLPKNSGRWLNKRIPKNSMVFQDNICTKYGFSLHFDFFFSTSSLCKCFRSTCLKGEMMREYYFLITSPRQVLLFGYKRRIMSFLRVDEDLYSSI